LNSEDFDLVFSRAKKFSEKKFLLLTRKNKYSYPRLGLIVAKKNVKLAVKRNRIKRIVRESFRNNKDVIKNTDVVFIAKLGIDKLSNKELRDKLDKIFAQVRNSLTNGGS
jgi:ribonuclease P protein component